MRMDIYLSENGYAESRQKAKYLIAQGMVWLDGKPCAKAAAETDGHTVEVRGEGLPYVSRGGLKLEAALRRFSLTAQGRIALDVGASTGGFTDCLLQNGAKKVYAVDSGSAQLHERLRSDGRVISMENRNARELSPDWFEEPPTLAVMDVSFISQSLLYEPLCRVLAEGAAVVTLIKPQFEVGRGDVGKGGIVKNEKAQIRILRELPEKAAAAGLFCRGMMVSPVKGGDGNREYLALFRRESMGSEKTKRMDWTDAGLKRLVSEGIPLIDDTDLL